MELAKFDLVQWRSTDDVCLLVDSDWQFLLAEAKELKRKRWG
jgi:hypothetical protein